MITFEIENTINKNVRPLIHIDFIDNTIVCAEFLFISYPHV